MCLIGMIWPGFAPRCASVSHACAVAFATWAGLRTATRGRLPLRQPAVCCLHSTGMLPAARPCPACLSLCYVTPPAPNSWANRHSTHPIAAWQVKTALQDWEREQALYVEVGTLLHIVDAWEG